MCTIGIDLGSVSVKLAILDETLRFRTWRRTHGRPLQATHEVFSEALSALGPDMPVNSLAVTGSGKALLAHALAALSVNEIVAHATATWTFHRDVRSIVEIGGQDSKFIEVGRDHKGRPFVEDHAFNELCAAGTGAFLDQMAEHMGMSLDEFAQAAATAAHPARVSGRCAVFAKTDLIHLKQRACPADEIAAGLCFALVRTYLANLCRGKTPKPPLVFQGGVAANAGVLRALRELTGISDIVVPKEAHVMGAIGAALIAAEQPSKKTRTLADIVSSLPRCVSNDTPSDLEPLICRSKNTVAHKAEAGLTPPFYLGLDVGSVTTKAVVIDRKGAIVTSCYYPTAGRPVTAIKQAMEAIKASFTGEIAYAVTTGSGRHLAADLTGADAAKDEITCQAISAAHFIPDVDTVFEIGGQDSKYIKIENGRVIRFQMNRACAAGTGSFLEEQARRLGISIHDFSTMAFASRSPVRMGSRCTVFMDSDLVHYLQNGACLEDLCAGLAHAIAANYIEKVVGSRQIGRRVVFQGGVALNDAVFAAFEAILGQELLRHPYPEVSGALGAALHALTLDGPSSFRGFDIGDVSIRTFDCRVCDNTCEIQEIRTSSERRSFFGSVCGRFEAGREDSIPADDAFWIRDRLLRDSCYKTSNTPFRGPIGLPFALSLTEHLPFWTTFLSALGFDVVDSGATDAQKTALGVSKVPAEFCQPMKVFFGHAHYLGKHGVQRLFVPHLRLFTPPSEETKRYACPYTQAAPYVLRAHMPEGVQEVFTIEYPVPDEDALWAKTAASALRVTEEEVKDARRLAEEAQAKFRQACLEEGQRLLERIKAAGQIGVVIIGRPYNTQDRRLNLNLARRLARLGLVPIPMDFLPLEPLPTYWNRVRWGYGREQLQAARFVRQNPFLTAVVVTNFGCGPDAFVDQYIEDELHDTPHIVLEFDDHQAEAGLITRIEAFRHSIGQGRRTERKRGTPAGIPTRPLREYTYWIPYFSDHARAYTGALASAGCRSVLLPPTDDESWQLGLRYAYGRECHPYISFLGDLIRASKRPDFVASEACYYGPSYFGPCLLPQYMVAMKLVLDRIGLHDVTLLNIADPPTMAPLGRGYILRLGFGIYAIDLLYRWKVEASSRELEPGSVSKAYHEALNIIEEGLATRRFFKSLPAAISRMSAVPLSPISEKKPVVGIIGDAYTRINDHANDRLIDRLTEIGFEVWAPCSLIDVSLLGSEQLHAEFERQGRRMAAMGARLLVPVIAGLRGLVDRYFPPTIRNPKVRQFPEVRQAADRLANHFIDKLLSLNLSRVEELRDAGATGVINVMCHNCMLGTITGALLQAKKGDGLASCTLVYEGLKSTHNVNRLEAFTHRLKSRL